MSLPNILTISRVPLMFIVVGLALAIYGGGLALSVWLGAWFRSPK